MLLKHLASRKILYQCTAASLPNPNFKESVYCGFDPTSKSLHLGNLLQIITLARIAQFGYTPIAIVGGATALLGDPSGKLKERESQNELIIEEQTKLIMNQIKNVWKNLPNVPELQVVNNKDFYRDISLIDFLAKEGRQFRMASLLGKEHIQARVQSGLSLTEFFYTILQAYDFRILNDKYNCTLQLGGSDQWGNITNGCDYVKRTTRNIVNGVTTPLLLSKNGEKFGKSEGNAIFLDSPRINIHQYLVNQVENSPDLARMLTFIPLEEINGEMPKRLSHEILSYLGKGKETNTEKLFYCDLISLKDKSEQEQREFFEDEEWEQSIKIDKKQWNQQGVLIEILGDAKKSRSQVRRLCESGGFYVNGRKRNLQEVQELKLSDEAYFNKYVVCRLGKKDFHILINQS